jgi:hypothetical protein
MDEDYVLSTIGEYIQLDVVPIVMGYYSCSIAHELFTDNLKFMKNVKKYNKLKNVVLDKNTYHYFYAHSRKLIVHVFKFRPDERNVGTFGTIGTIGVSFTFYDYLYQKIDVFSDTGESNDIYSNTLVQLGIKQNDIRIMNTGCKMSQDWRGMCWNI